MAAALRSKETAGNLAKYIAIKRLRYTIKI